ncbi:hypothetical protein PR048_020284 [Dryococelus australis]|uniref:DUF5641 domain-containing protein n=1 Tax=Dryococelus australis TaxID=614101 RepID=A0ABQ9H5V5_9NEOP|nr:hypothetical protein PR048_020284 [Dryococelus australis]
MASGSTSDIIAAIVPIPAVGGTKRWDRPPLMEGCVRHLRRSKKEGDKPNVTRAVKAIDKLTSGDLIGFNVDASGDESEAHDEDLGEVQDRLTTLLVRLHKLGTENSAIVSPNSEVDSEVRLPKLQLLVFGGNLKDWLSFKDLFESAVHSNKTLTGAQKLHYLKGSIQGKAATLLKSVPITSVNYTEACGILTTQYQNKRELVDTTLKRLFSRPVVQQESVVMLRRLLDSVVECTRLLKVLGQPVEHWDSILVFLVTERLDCESRKEWQLSLTDDELPKFEKLVQFQEHRTRALAVANVTKPKTSTTVITRRLQGNRSLSALHGTTQDNGCMQCAGSHTLYKCPELLVAPVQERYTFDKKVASHYSAQPVSSRVLLSTGLVSVQDCRGTFTSVRALLYSASEASFVTEICIQKLGLKKQRLNVPVFTVKALMMPKLMGYFPKESIVPEKSWSHITGLRLADPMYNIPGKVDIILGGDIYPWLLRPGRCIGADSIPAALKLQAELISLLTCGGFQLRQWSSNAPEILEVKTSGPGWLHEPGPLQDSDVVKPDQDIMENERKITVATAHIVPKSSLLSRWSSLRQIQRVTAWCLRFGKNCKTSHTERVSHPLTVHELHTALLRWIIIVQRENFSEEIYCLKNDKLLPSKSRIASLAPLLDKDGVLRVGGRLQKACISEEHSSSRGTVDASVKSMKYHLHRVVGHVTLNFEEFYTVLTMIEACLNSRQLTALSSDPSDLLALTPGHFLIDSLLAIPEAGESLGKLNHVARWQLVQRVVKHFWQRWSSEYLSRLQNRPKWWIKKDNLHIGDMMILKDEQLPAQQWKIGRIVNTFPGDDGLAWTATEKPAFGEFKQPVVKTVLLPF